MPNVISITDYLKLPTPPQRWLLDNLIPTQSFTVLWGPPKSGKTLVSLQLAQAIANGTPFLGVGTHPAPVLYVELDTGQTLFRSMLQNLSTVQPFGGPLWLQSPEALAEHYPLNLLHERSQLYLHSLVSEVQPGLVIVDCLSELGNQDENEQHDMKAIISALKHLTTFHPLFPCACLLLHHTVKFDYGNKNYPIPSPLKAGRGSGYLAGAADSVWFHHRLSSDSDPNAVVKIVPRFTEPSNIFIKQGAGGQWTRTS